MSRKTTPQVSYRVSRIVISLLMIGVPLLILVATIVIYMGVLKF